LFGSLKIQVPGDEQIEAWRLEVRVLQQGGFHQMKAAADTNLLVGAESH